MYFSWLNGHFSGCELRNPLLPLALGQIKAMNKKTASSAGQKSPRKTARSMGRSATSAPRAAGSF
jgi:hypothetical protein